MSLQAARAEPSARTESASDCALAGAGEVCTEADHEPPAGLRTGAHMRRAGPGVDHVAQRLPDPSMPMRGVVWAALPGSSRTLVLAAQAAPPDAKVQTRGDGRFQSWISHVMKLAPSAASSAACVKALLKSSVGGCRDALPGMERR